jgi:hypothetical protein
MAPEQAQGGVIDHRADLFSLGSVLYTMCSGRPPFRAPTSLGVLKRVVEDSPRPIHEIISEVPKWLCDIIAKLHAKRPEDRFQTAKEVADLFARCEKQYEAQGLVAPLPKPAQSSSASPTPRLAILTTRLRSFGSQGWIIATVALLLLLGSLSLSEATGITRVAATVIRFLTPEGTLVVETNDPDVKVTIEGDGGLVISGAGLHEVRLKPGSYQLKADKGGQRVSLDQEVVSIARGDKQVVRVRLESTNPAAASAVVTPKLESGVFTLLGAKGVAERKFDTLAAAVQASYAGDTIEIRGNGPFAIDPLVFKTALVIRAGDGFRPVIEASDSFRTMIEARSENWDTDVVLLQADAPLVLEGLELRCEPRQRRVVGRVFFLRALNALHVANCRFLTRNTDRQIVPTHAGPADVRNCEFLLVPTYKTITGEDYGASAVAPWAGTHLIMDNCLTTSSLTTTWSVGDTMEGSMRLTRNTFRTRWQALLFGATDRDNGSGKFAEMDWPAKALQVEAMDNLFHGSTVLNFAQTAAKTLPPGDAEACLARMVGWRGERNLYLVEKFLRVMGRTPSAAPWVHQPTKLPVGLPGWKQLWGSAEDESTEGPVRFEHGDPLAKIENTLETVTPEDFRLRPDSAGYRAGRDGKDLGADVDLVGPGAAYERWKKTPDYQSWLSDTNQRRPELPAPPSGAFVVLNASGREKQYETLAAAVQASYDGDTIEIRGNGPFAIDPLVLKTPLVIRAGDGFRPVLEASDSFRSMIEARSEPWRSDVVLLQAEAPLVLEGLEFRCWLRDRKVMGWIYVLKTSKALHAANCRFLTRNTDYQVSPSDAGQSEVRNCEFLSSQKYNAFAIRAYFVKPLVVDNCLLTGRIYVDHRMGQARDTSLRLTRNTFQTGRAALQLDAYDSETEKFAAADWTNKALRLEASDNVFRASTVFNFGQASEEILSPGEAEACLTRMVGWQGERNLYSVNFAFLLLQQANPWRDLPPAKLPTGLAGWKELWGSAEAGPMEGPIRYQHGDPLAKIENALETVSPDDFRLRSDSAGYRAGPGGKDLGADVDLVGPGPAYERWKQTPAFQQWLTETGQTSNSNR